MADENEFPDAGAGGGGGQGASGAPTTDRQAAYEARLDKMGQSIDQLLNRTRKDEEVREAEGKLAQIRTAVTESVNKLKGDVKQAEDALAAAYDEGEGKDIARAQRILSERAARLERIQSDGARLLKEQEAKIKAEPKKDTADSDGVDRTELNKWLAANPWYNTDAEKRTAANQIDAALKAEGQILTGTPQYFEAINKRMAEKFPAFFKGSPGSAGGGSGEQVGQAQTRVDRETAEAWRRMGINVDDPDTVKRMLGHRQTAVEKGILPQTPITGRVLAR